MAVLNLYLRLFITLVIFFASPVRGYAAENIVLHEQEIKAGLLYNFLKYTEWPSTKLEQTPATIEVCILGGGPFSSYLKPMEGRTVNQRTITINNINSVKDADKCNLLFVNSSQKKQWSELSGFLTGKPVLTVSDFKDFGKLGGMIEFNLINSHITAELNLETLRSAQLRVQDRLLKLVSVVKSSSQNERR